MSTRFEVSDVPVATTPPALVPLASALDPQRARGAVAMAGPSAVVAGPRINALLHAAHLAFHEHRPLTLAPDDLWLTVLQGIAQHIARQPEALRSRFVAHAGALAIQIRRDDLHPAADPPGDWSTVPSELCAEVLTHTGAAARALRASFSTTDPAARVAMDVALLDALQSYFSYSVASLCGIPSVTLLGVPADWADMTDRLGALTGLGLDPWIAALRVVLTEIHEASLGRANRAFWERLYKPFDASGGERVTGWINVLFPYLSGSSARAPRELVGYLSEQGAPRSGAFDAPTASEIPLGLSSAPFEWELPGEHRAMALIAGHVGVAYDAVTGAVRPAFGWWVAPARPPSVFQLHNASSERCAIMPRDAASLRSLRSIADEASGYPALELTLGWCPELPSLDGLESLEHLARLSLTECNQITSLAPLAGLTELVQVSVSQCASLEDIGALATLPALETVVVMHCPRVTDLRALASLPALRRAVLWKCAGVPERFRNNLTDRAEILALQAWLRAQTDG